MEKDCKGDVWVWDMIRTKKSNTSKVEVLPPQDAAQSLQGLEQGQSKPNPHLHPGFVNSPYYGNPPDHTKWKPGQSGNPNGRPPHKVLSRELWRKLSIMDSKTGLPKYYELLDALIKKAMGNGPGSGYHLKEIMDRIDGPLAQRLEVGAVIITNPLGRFNGDISKLSDAELVLAERLGLLALAKARQLQQQGEQDD